MLQGHMDMVCEKNAGVNHDFMTEGLKLKVEDGILTADGTTLGADNGVAVALMLMVLDDENLAHPPVECVFTTEEEVGLNGASALDKSLITARTMINMDSEEEGIGTVSCAGGLRIQFERPIKREEAEGTLLQIEIGGLKGGHSGMDIDKERQNSIRLMARVVWQLMKNTDGKLVEFTGGSKGNAIPRECRVSMIYADPAEAEKAEELAKKLAETLTEEVVPYENSFVCTVEKQAGAKAEAIPTEDAKAFVAAMYLAPNGVQSRNTHMDGFVVSSVNMGVAQTEKDQLVIIFLPRSSVASLQDDMKARMGLLAETFGFTTSYSGEYPGWSYRETSRIREVFKESYRELFGQEMQMEAIHAGLECGLFSDALPGLDAIAVGPTLNHVHTPEENVPLDSFERFYELLKDVLKRLTEK